MTLFQKLVNVLKKFYPNSLIFKLQIKHKYNSITTLVLMLRLKTDIFNALGPVNS
jgi:hypothetical protein